MTALNEAGDSRNPACVFGEFFGGGTAVRAERESDVLPVFKRLKNVFELAGDRAVAPIASAASRFEEGYSRKQENVAEGKEESIRVVLRAGMGISRKERLANRDKKVMRAPGEGLMKTWAAGLF
jgi:hypothetical protein